MDDTNGPAGRGAGTGSTADGTGSPPTASDSDSVGFVRFHIGGFPLAAEAGYVGRVSPVPERTRLPGAPDPVVGLGYVAGEPTVLVTLHDRLGVDATSGDRRVVVVRIGDRQPVGVLADDVAGTISVPVEAVSPPDEVQDPFPVDPEVESLFRAVLSTKGGWAYVVDPSVVLGLVTLDGAAE